MSLVLLISGALSDPVLFDSAEIRHILNKIHTVRRHIKRKQTGSRLAKLKTLEDKLQLVIELSKEKYIAGLVDTFQSEPKKLYRYLKKVSSKQAVNTFIGLDNRVLQDLQSTSNAFNKFFNSTFTISEGNHWESVGNHWESVGITGSLWESLGVCENGFVHT